MKEQPIYKLEEFVSLYNRLELMEQAGVATHLKVNLYAAPEGVEATKDNVVTKDGVTLAFELMEAYSAMSRDNKKTLLAIMKKAVKKDKFAGVKSLWSRK